MRILVTGCGCSGTQWTAGVLASLGLRGGHERVYGSGSDPAGAAARWEGRDFEVGWPAAAFLDRLPPHTVVWHQVRDPLKVARCWASHRMLGSEDDGPRLIRRTLGGDWGADHTADACRYVVGWNKLIEHFLAANPRIIGYRCRIESLDAERLSLLLLNAGFRVEPERVERAVRLAAPTTGACPGLHRPLDWADVRGTGLRDLAVRYGYGPVENE